MSAICCSLRHFSISCLIYFIDFAAGFLQLWVLAKLAWRYWYCYQFVFIFYFLNQHKCFIFMVCWLCYHKLRNFSCLVFDTWYFDCMYFRLGLCIFFYKKQRCSACLFWLLILPASNCTFHIFENLKFLVWSFSCDFVADWSFDQHCHLLSFGLCKTVVWFCWLCVIDFFVLVSVKNLVLIYLQRWQRDWLGLSFSWSIEFDVAISFLSLSIFE